MLALKEEAAMKAQSQLQQDFEQVKPQDWLELTEV